IGGIDVKQRAHVTESYTQILTELGGLRTVMAAMQQQNERATGQIKQSLAAQVAFLKGRLVGLQEALVTLSRLPDTVERDEQMLAIVTTANGALGAVEWLDEQIKLLSMNETYSSFDSELSLLFWLDYPLMRWQPNLLHHRYDKSPLRTRHHTLMVSRLEAHTVAITKRLIDDAIATDEGGLQGKMYLDARGLRGTPSKNLAGSYVRYDDSLRDLDALAREHAELDVVLDNKSGLFQAGDCPQTSLYCGWYSLGKYVDAFDFVRGAVGYHMASSEATTLRKADSQVWCKRMLEDGICATLGPVHEPYLAAFPHPDEFFAVLGSGKYSLVEAYYRTKPFNSWVMVLVGDPLYNPFRNRPLIAADKLPGKYQRIITVPSND
ncbi:MAG: TIGR03790 family protein, partial [Planctomycetota bacterium]